MSAPKSTRPSRPTIRMLPEWIYPRPEGDLTAFALTADEALEVMRLGGYTNLDPKKLRRTSKVLGDELSPIDAEHMTVESERRALGLASTLPAPPDKK